MNVESGTGVEIGCRHAEMNLICNAAQMGPHQGCMASCDWQPCMMCAKLIHHTGIGKVVIVDGGFGGENGIGYLENHGVNIQRTKAQRARF